MKREAKPRAAWLWKVRCPGHPEVPVTADSWEEAVMAAAELWGVSFARVAAYCDCAEKHRVTVTTCPRCKRNVYNCEDQDGLCDRCRKVAAAERAELRLRMRKTAHLARKTPATRKDWRR